MQASKNPTSRTYGSYESVKEAILDLVKKFEKPVRPIPYPSSRSHAEWNAFLEGLSQKWGGWANPGSRTTSRGETESESLAFRLETRFHTPVHGQLTQPANLTATPKISTSFRYDQP